MPETQWLVPFLPLAWCGHITLGLAVGILGPSQPYLASAVGTTTDKINLIWTWRSVGVCLVCVATSHIIKHLATATWQKITFLAASQLVAGIFVALVPFSTNFTVLLASETRLMFFHHTNN